MLQFTALVILSLIHHSYGQNALQPMGATSVEDILKILQNQTIDVNEGQICEPPRRCVHHYQCLEDGTFNKRGAGIVNIRFNDDDSNKIKEGNKVYDVPLSNHSITRNGIAVYVCNYLQQCCGSTPISKIETSSRSTSNGCGFRNPGGVLFKINDTDKAQYGEFPWMVAVIWHHPTKDMPALVGGGSLIHPKVILTAAHILGDKTPNEFNARAGEWDTQTDSELYPHQERNVNQIIRHEEYDLNGLLNDYALLIVNEAFILGPNIQPICLPRSTFIFDDEPNCYSTGWGKDKFSNAGRRQAILKKIRLPIVEFELCQNQLRKTQLGDIFELHDSFLCAGGEAGQDTCTGDGGSPLICPVYNQQNRYYQAGIVAWGLNCGQANVPGVYANTALAREWIDAKMTMAGFGTDSYSVK